MTRLTREQAAIVSAYTGVLCGDFSAMHEYVETKLGRPVFTHEMASASVWAEIKEACRSDFLAIVQVPA